MANQWYYNVNGKTHGPISTSELKSLAQSGFFEPSTKIMKAGMTKWVAASSWKGLLPTAPTPSPTPPPKRTQTSASENVWEQLEVPPNDPDAERLGPSSGEAVASDDDAREAWKERQSPSKGHLGPRGMFKKSIKDAVFSHRRRVFRHYENGREIALDELLDRLEQAYSDRGFGVSRYTTSLIVTKSRTGSK